VEAYWLLTYRKTRRTAWEQRFRRVSFPFLPGYLGTILRGFGFLRFVWFCCLLLVRFLQLLHVLFTYKRISDRQGFVLDRLAQKKIMRMRRVCYWGFSNSFAWVLCGAVYVCWNKCCFQFTDSALFLSSISSISVYFAIPKKWRQQQDVNRCLCMCFCVCFLTMVMLFVYNLVYSLLGDFDALYLCVYVVLLSVIVTWFHFKFVYFARSFLSRRVGGCTLLKTQSKFSPPDHSLYPSHETPPTRPMGQPRRRGMVSGSLFHGKGQLNSNYAKKAND